MWSTAKICKFLVDMSTGSVNAIISKPLSDSASLKRYAISGSSSTMAMKLRAEISLTPSYDRCLYNSHSSNTSMCIKPAP